MILIHLNPKKHLTLCLFLMPFLLIWLIACQADTASPTSSAASPAPFFPREQAAQADTMDALLVGKLILAQECLRLQDSDNNNYLLIWPQGFSLTGEGDSLEIHDATGKLVARLNEDIEVSGGETPETTISSFVAETIPSNCQGPYWLVASVQ